jgi:hypothetical protein
MKSWDPSIIAPSTACKQDPRGLDCLRRVLRRSGITTDFFYEATIVVTLKANRKEKAVELPPKDLSRGMGQAACLVY